MKLWVSSDVGDVRSEPSGRPRSGDAIGPGPGIALPSRRHHRHADEHHPLGVGRPAPLARAPSGHRRRQSTCRGVRPSVPVGQGHRERRVRFGIPHPVSDLVYCNQFARHLPRPPLGRFGDRAQGPGRGPRGVGVHSVAPSLSRWATASRSGRSRGTWSTDESSNSRSWKSATGLAPIRARGA